ncbi:putative bifunctional fatty acid transporter/acyl-CoA synthetase [Xylogone sp. PMI_703]|nr:putative bifunctional fatty acid transporter/acyl-CoA synthetase [Xylogone sp. PMI_703]
MDSSLSALALPVVVSALGSAYLNAKLGITRDIKQLRYDRTYGKIIAQNIARVGNSNMSTLAYALKSADKTAEGLWFEGRSWTYGEWEQESDRIAILLQWVGVRAGSTVAIYMKNSPEMVFTVFAAAKLGAVVALLNPGTRGRTLIHCLKVSESKFMITAPDLRDAVAEVLKEADPLNLTCVCLNCDSLDTPGPESSETETCVVSNQRMAVFTSTSPADLSNPKKYFPLRTYSCLPLYHGTAFCIGLCYSIGASSTLCLARKFSRTNFWRDIVESRATRILYVGELCRYLLSEPPTSLEQSHSCHSAWGNGLQKDIWEEFKGRFNIPEIREFYRSADSLVKFDNWGAGAAGAGKIGWTGVLGRYMEDDKFIVRLDYDEEAPYRDPKTGHCVPAEIGEPGEAIARIRSPADYPNYFQNQEAIEKRLLKDVFRNGDLFQRSGDLIVQDSSGWVQFHDRIGDTFRWKGENVSAGEVRSYLCELPNVLDAIVYAVKLTGYDGQVGAAGITLRQHSPSTEAAFVNSLFEALRSKGVPSYAVPRLLRITAEITVNHTFKHAKDALKKRSWDPELTAQSDGDSLYWLDGEIYRQLDKESWIRIERAAARL